MSSPWENWTADKAIDGKNNTAADVCLCCSACVGTGPKWWRLDLGLSYFIQSITFIGRSGKYITAFIIYSFLFFIYFIDIIFVDGIDTKILLKLNG